MPARTYHRPLAALLATLALGACEVAPMTPAAAPGVVVTRGAVAAATAGEVSLAVGAHLEAAGCRRLQTVGLDENWRTSDVTFVRFTLFREGAATSLATLDVPSADVLADPGFQVHFNHLRHGATYRVEARAFHDPDGTGPNAAFLISHDGSAHLGWKSQITVGDNAEPILDAGSLAIVLVDVHVGGASQLPGVYNDFAGSCRAELSGAVSTVAGSAAGPFVEGAVGKAAHLGKVSDLVRRSDGTLFAALWDRHAVVRISPVRRVYLVAGAFGTPGFAAGCTKFASRLTNPTGLALSADGNTLYIADGGNHRVVKVNLASADFGQLGAAANADSTYLELVAGPDDAAVGAAPLNQATGFIDGSAAASRFNMPSGLALAGDGALVVVDRFNHAIRRLAGGVTETIANTSGSPGYGNDANADYALFSNPSGILKDGDAIVAHGTWAFLISDRDNNAIRRLVPSGVDGWAVTTWYVSDGDGDTMDALVEPSGLTADAHGRVWVGINDGVASVRMIDRAKLLQADGPDLATQIWVSDKLPTYRDGAAADARFQDGATERFVPLAADPAGRIFFGDEGAGSVRLLQ